MSSISATVRGSAAMTVPTALILALGILCSSASAAPGGKSKVRINPTSYHQLEAGGAVEVRLTRTKKLTGTTTVNFSTAPGTAVPGSDYTSVSIPVTFNAGETSKAVSVPVLDDGVPEAAETVNLSVRAVSGAAGGSAGTLTIIDDDGDDRIAFAAAAESAAENAGSVAIEVVRSGDVSQPASVSYAATGGTAPAGNYSAPAGTLSFAAGEALKSFNVDLVNVPGPNGSSTVEFTLSSPSGAELAQPATTTLTILDDETPAQVRFAVESVTVGESGGLALISVTRSGFYTGDEVSVDYTTADGTAGAEDYTATTDTLVLEGPNAEVAGDQGEESALIEIPITADSLDEADETFTVTLSNVVSSGGAVLGTPASATVTITDDDAPADPVDPDPVDPNTPTNGTDGTNGSNGSAGGTAGAGAGSEQSGPLSADVQILRKRVLRKRGLKLRVTCSAACAAGLKGKLRIKGSKAIKLTSKTAQLATGAPAVVRLKLNKKRLRAVKRALAGRTTLRAVVTLRATDASGAVVTVTRKLRLRR